MTTSLAFPVQQNQPRQILTTTASLNPLTTSTNTEVCKRPARSRSFSRHKKSRSTKMPSLNHLTTAFKTRLWNALNARINHPKLNENELMDSEFDLLPHQDARFWLDEGRKGVGTLQCDLHAPFTY